MPDSPGAMKESLRDDESAFRQDIEKWALAAVPVLQEVAGSYGGFITYKALATRVFEETKTSTRMLVPNFSSRLLNRVIRLCLKNNLPALTSLVVSATDGTVGTGFDAVLRASGREVPDTALERERIAAAERLECYKKFGADVPIDAKPQLTPKYEARVNPPKQEAPRPKPVCSVHGIQLPATGVCDDCA
ncbi:hypothetical protein QF031_002324 [Pseudarthrobacter defluvii]|uniref:hypothetical protein n=1 Tax=Pseudarthrobacter defluvii TaxID=410837 RepID=UPI00277F1B5E|nr:hypothetical protein [Pseudarthrobacter defluvii]MDQ0769575.1 hypothetical protein [Pseudarthrobacter defluvii]